MQFFIALTCHVRNKVYVIMYKFIYSIFHLYNIWYNKVYCQVVLKQFTLNTTKDIPLTKKIVPAEIMQHSKNVYKLLIRNVTVLL